MDDGVGGVCMFVRLSRTNIQPFCMVFVCEFVYKFVHYSEIKIKITFFLCVFSSGAIMLRESRLTDEIASLPKILCFFLQGGPYSLPISFYRNNNSIKE